MRRCFSTFLPLMLLALLLPCSLSFDHARLYAVASPPPTYQTEFIPLQNIKQIAVGDTHSCALMTNGSVKCWGRNDYGQLGDGSTVNKNTPIEVSGLRSGVAAITAGGSQTCALMIDGSIKCWGGNWNGQLGNGTTVNQSLPVEVSGLSRDATAISAGSWHTCALIRGGAKCWGHNDYGQLGDGTTLSKNTPTDVSDLSSGVTAISAGDGHTCALMSSGGVKCWGANWAGELGDGSTEHKNMPVGVNGLNSGITAISAGGQTCALTTSGGVKCWGENGFGQLGDGSTIGRSTPVGVSGLSSGVTAIASGSDQSCALTIQGSVKCWGRNDFGQLGDGTTSGDGSTIGRSTPVEVIGMSSGITTIASGGSQSCALTNSGTVQCWGYNPNNQRNTPVEVHSLNNDIAAIAAGDNQTCALTTTGSMKCWGYNGNGQLGNGTTNHKNMPVAVIGLGSSIKSIDTGGGSDMFMFPNAHTCAVTINGAAMCWGANNYGQLGNGTTVAENTPVAVNGLSHTVVAISTGNWHTCAVTDSRGVKCWGANDSGQLGDDTTVGKTTPIDVSGLANNVAAITAGNWHTCALITSGGVKCWGGNWAGQLGDNTTSNKNTPVWVSGLSSDVAAIMAGGNQTCALTTSGGVKCWGDGGNGQLGDGTTVSKGAPVDVHGLSSGIIAIAAGSDHTCALTTSGAVKCWGYNGNGQLGDATTMSKSTPVDVHGLSTGITAIAAGNAHTCVLTTSGSAKCWGSNSYGQIGDGTAWHTAPIDVIEGVYPDLAIVDMTIQEVGIPTCGATAYSLPRVARVTVRNDGLAAAGAFVVSLNNSVTQTVTAGVTAGATTVVEFTSGFQNGNNTVSLDAYDQVQEEDESNNTFTKDIWMPMATPIPTCTPTSPNIEAPTPTFTPTPTPTAPANALKQWTMMLYLAGDTGRIDGGTVFGELRKAVRRLENAPNPDVNVVALLDGPNDLDSFRETFTPQLHDTPVGEMPMDDPLTLVNFVKQAQHEFPAEHYYLVIADHANGVQGIGWDTTTAPNKTALLTPAKLAQAFQQMSEDGAAPIDVVHFDGCSFGLLENMATMRNYARYLVMSQNIGWSVFAYDQYRAALTATTSPDAFAKTVARLYGQIVRAKELPYTISAIDLSQLDAVLPALNGLADALMTYVGNDASRRATVTAARTQSQKFDSTRPLFEITNDDWYVDLVDFAINVQTQIADPPLSTAANHLIATVKTGPTPLVIYESHLTASIVQNSTDNCPDGELWQLDNANGVSLYFPPRTGSSEFTHYSSGDTFTYFTTQSHWDEFLQGGVPPLAPGDPPPDDAPIPLAHCSVTDAQTATEKQLFLPIVRR